MRIRDIVPWKRKEKQVPARGGNGDDSVQALRRDLNHLFDEFLTPYTERRPMKSLFGGSEGAFVPTADVTENSKEVTVSMEVPGVDEKDVEVTLDGNALIVRGEKKREEKSEKGDYYHYERSYGSFQRVVPLPEGIVEEQAKACFKKGVLTVTIPKSEEARSRRKKIEVET